MRSYHRLVAIWIGVTLFSSFFILIVPFWQSLTLNPTEISVEDPAIKRTWDLTTPITEEKYSWAVDINLPGNPAGYSLVVKFYLFFNWTNPVGKGAFRFLLTFFTNDRPLVTGTNNPVGLRMSHFMEPNLTTWLAGAFMFPSDPHDLPHSKSFFSGPNHITVRVNASSEIEIPGQGMTVFHIYFGPLIVEVAPIRSGDGILEPAKIFPGKNAFMLQLAVGVTLWPVAAFLNLVYKKGARWTKQHR